MNSKIRNRIIRTLILAIVAFAIGGGVAYYQLQFQTARVLKQGDQQAANISPVAGLKIGGPFTLTDHTGEKVTEKDFEGQYRLVYFGFTFCPAICPTDLQKIAKVLNTLGPYADNITPLFITIDPERDTVEVMKENVALYHPRIIGLTGTQPQIDSIMQKYRIFATKVENPHMSDYTFDHSTFIYLMNPDDELVSIYRLKDTAEFMVEDIKKKVVYAKG